MVVVKVVRRGRFCAGEVHASALKSKNRGRSQIKF